MQVLSSYQDPISSAPATCKVQSTKSCTFAHVQVPRSYQDLISRSYFYITSYLQGAKCKILHLCTHASIKFLSRSNFFITPYIQGAKYKILHICTRTYTNILSTPNFKILFLHHLPLARCKVQDLAHLHTCKYEVLIKVSPL